jgi:glycosyltransferase involved in cell wall biosynthesis
MAVPEVPVKGSDRSVGRGSGERRMAAIRYLRPHMDEFWRMPAPLVSVIINNYNYGRFLGTAIDSALRQEYPAIEVVVVDDGSGDNSRDVIASYGNRVTAVLKANGGQGSAFNAGIAASRGDILCFLDADDWFLPGKLERVVDVFSAHGLNAKPLLVHHFLALASEPGSTVDDKPHGRMHASPLNLCAFAKRYRFIWNEAGPTSALSINRSLAKRLFPIPEAGVRISADDFVIGGASLRGELHSMRDVLAGYRIHDANNWFGSSQRKSRQFLATFQDYLNKKLLEEGRPPTISFEDSIYVWDLLLEDRQWGKLLWHMMRLSIAYHDRYTMLFVYHTLMKIAQRGAAGLRRHGPHCAQLAAQRGTE